MNNVVIVGGGTAGWLAACLITARAGASLRVTLVESPDIPTIGVGEGTWPTMRRTLQRIGLSEPAFLIACDAAFKQGSRFIGWRDGGPDDRYLHPFTAPADCDPRDLVAAWATTAADRPYADAVTPQAQACALDLAPRTAAMPDYAGALNYAYHFDAGKFAALLAAHGVARLGVRHVRDHVTGIDRADDGGIAAVRTRGSSTISGDLFLDCTGHRALLLGEVLEVPSVDRGTTLFNDRALAVQVPVRPDSPVAAQTDATAHAAGWIWDIGLPTRRGIGCVYASAFMTDDEAECVLRDHVGRVVPGADVDALHPRRLAFQPGHRARFWEANCIAIGLSAGFVEPLEASAIVLIELSVEALLDDFPLTRAGMAPRAARFNTLFRYRWDRIVEFLKLHYLPGTRTEPYWQAHRDPAGVPDRLVELMALWRDRAPTQADFPMIDEIFPAASHAYVLYGMGAPPPPAPAFRREGLAAGTAAIVQAAARGRVLASSLPPHRACLDALARDAGAVTEVAR